MGKILISIIIPTFNRAHYLRRAIDSVIKQISENWELIVVDDGSVDNTAFLVQEYSDNRKIRYCYQKNSGVSVARNVGAKLSKGDYLIFLDSDDKFEPGLIQYLNQIHLGSYHLVCWDVLKVVDGKKMIQKPKSLGGMYNNIRASFLAGSICYRKDLFFEAGGYDPKMTFGENYELGLRISQFPELKIKIIRHQLSVICLEKSKRMSNSLENRINSYFHLYKKHRKKYNLHKKDKAQINYLLGFVMEKTKKKSAAFQFYKISFFNNPMNLKAILKLIYLKLF